MFDNTIYLLCDLIDVGCFAFAFAFAGLLVKINSTN